VVVAREQLASLLHASGLRRQGDDVIADAIQAVSTLISQCHQCWPEDIPLHADPWRTILNYIVV